MTDEKKKTTTRRDALKTIGAAGAATAGIGLTSGSASAYGFEYSADIEFYSEVRSFIDGAGAVSDDLESLSNMLGASDGFDLNSDYTAYFNYDIPVGDAPGISPNDSNVDGSEWGDWVANHFPEADDPSVATVILADFGEFTNLGRNVITWESDTADGSLSLVNRQFFGYDARTSVRGPIAQHEVLHAFGANHDDGTFDVNLDGRLQPSVMGAGYTQEGSAEPASGKDFRGVDWEQGLSPSYTNYMSDATAGRVVSEFDGASWPSYFRRTELGNDFFDISDW